MSTQLLDIQPRELKFIFEAKKQSSCAIQLVNISDHYVAFKVKTTSPKKYCVRPNTGVIKPKSKCDFTVTMQAQRSAPSDLQCKDKFLVQSTAVPLGTTEDDITPGMFAKDSVKHIEESKLRVVLISPPQSPVLLPSNGVMKQEPSYETSIQKDKLLTGVENLPPPPLADLTIVRLTEERSTNIQHKETLKQELATLRRNNGGKKVQVGFPLLFVCMVALISLTVGYLLHH